MNQKLPDESSQDPNLSHTEKGANVRMQSEFDEEQCAFLGAVF